MRCPGVSVVLRGDGTHETSKALSRPCWTHSDTPNLAFFSSSSTRSVKGNDPAFLETSENVALLVFILSRYVDVVFW